MEEETVLLIGLGTLRKHRPMYYENPQYNGNPASNLRVDNNVLFG